MFIFFSFGEDAEQNRRPYITIFILINLHGPSHTKDRASLRTPKSSRNLSGKYINNNGAPRWGRECVRVCVKRKKSHIMHCVMHRGGGGEVYVHYI